MVFSKVPGELAALGDFLDERGLREARWDHLLGNLAGNIGLIWLIADQLPLFVVAIDKAGSILRVNRTMREAVGRSEDEIVGRNYVATLIPPEQWELVGGALSRIQSTEFESAGRHPLCARDGRRIVADWRGRLIHDIETDVDYILGVGIDSTAQHQAHCEKDDVQAQLFQSQKMEAVGRLAGGVAHDFNNLLTAILGITELAMMRPVVPERTMKDLERIQLAAVRAAELTRQILLLGYKQPADTSVQVVAINETIQDLLKLLQRLIGEDVKVVGELDPASWPIRGNPGNLTQMFLNLAVNARDAMPKGGRLALRTRNVSFTAEDCEGLPEARPGRFVCISVADTGVGMDRALQERIFEPFFSTKEPGQGTGLGLSVVNGIVHQHQGWIRVSSEPNQGATFAIFLPAWERPVTRDVRKKVRLSEIQGRGECILVVEDEPVVLEFTARALRENGYEVCTATTVREAREAFHRDRSRIRLLFSDVVLPDGTGIQLAERLLGQMPDLKIVLTSGYSDERTRSPNLQEAQYRYLQKPYALVDLLRTVKGTFDGLPGAVEEG